MAALYDSGYGNDQQDAYNSGGNYNDEAERRRREQAQQQGQQQSFRAQQQEAPNQYGQQTAGVAQAQQQAQQNAPAQSQAVEKQKTFAQMQQSGEARPAPPPQPAAQMQQMQQQMQQMRQPMQQYSTQDAENSAQQMGLDPIAAAANPQGYFAHLQQMQQYQQQGQQFRNPRNLGGDIQPLAGGPAQMMQEYNSGANREPEQDRTAAGGFTGDLGQFYSNQLNNSTLPQTPYSASADMFRQAGTLGNMALPATPQYTQDPQVMNSIQQMNAGMAANGGYTMPGVSAAGVNPLHAAGASSAGGATGAGGQGGASAGSAAQNSTTVTGSSSGGQPVGGADARTALSQALRNPSAFDNEEVMKLYGRLGQNIDDDFSQRDTALREEMAQRGLSDTSIMGGRMRDLNVGRRGAQTELATQLGIQRAQDFGNARNQAIGLGLQQTGQDNSFSLGNASNAMQSRGLDLQSNNQAYNQRMGGLQFQNQLGQQGFQNQLASGEFGLKRAGQQFGQGMAGLQMQNQMGQQGFDNQMALSGQRYNQNMGWSNALNQYGQQAFNNDMATNQFNANQQRDSDAFLYQMLGLGG